MRALTLSLFTALAATLAFAGCDQIDTGKGPVVDTGRPGSDMPPATKTDPATRTDPITPADPNLPPPVSPPVTPPVLPSPTAPGTTADTTPPPGTRPDNTAINQRDAADLRKAKTPIDQDENQADIDVTANIRQRVVAEKDFSINAQNVKIITSKGMVTLRGPVNSQAEHDTIAKIAREVAGEGKVDNQLEIKPQER
jgi:hyperosmotically inducible protein